MNELIEKLLQPVPGDLPCGPDLSNDAVFDELQTLLNGKPEIDIGSVQRPAEPPDWVELKDRSAAYLKNSKHLRVAMMLCCSLLKTNGLAGFRDGLQLIDGLLENSWGAVYPLLDPEDNNDPTYRLNILGGLTAPRGSVSGWLTILDYLYVTPLCRPKGGAPISFELLQAAKPKEPGAEGSPPVEGPSLDAIQAAFRSVPDQVSECLKVLEESLAIAKHLDQVLTATLSAGSSISFEELHRTLQLMILSVQPFVVSGDQSGAGADAVSAEGGEAGIPGAVGESRGIQVSGVIRSRDDVIRNLESICKYYQQVEPGSPVPYLLRRAQKLATMNFVEAMQELSLATPDTLRPAMGSAVGGAEAAVST